MQQMKRFGIAINNPETFYIIGSVVGPHPYPAMIERIPSDYFGRN